MNCLRGSKFSILLPLINSYAWRRFLILFFLHKIKAKYKYYSIFFRTESFISILISFNIILFENIIFRLTSLPFSLCYCHVLLNFYVFFSFFFLFLIEFRMLNILRVRNKCEHLLMMFSRYGSVPLGFRF